MRRDLAAIGTTVKSTDGTHTTAPSLEQFTESGAYSDSQKSTKNGQNNSSKARNGESNLGKSTATPNWMEKMENMMREYERTGISHNFKSVAGMKPKSALTLQDRADLLRIKGLLFYFFKHCLVSEVANYLSSALKKV